ncbi:hypothetical protein DGWBC_0903 [Dehalogenimonas sp. WBC-2]|nr:hypothetical protein DGWBC_0903 [Dehalogenimonas sp. WBC-2]
MLDLIIIAVLSVLLVPLVNFTDGTARIVLGLIFILFSPGYSLIAALFPRNGSLGGIERIALSFGLSIALVPLIGLALNYTEWGIRQTPILLSVLAFIVIMAAIAWYRRSRLEPDDRFRVKIAERLPSLKKSWASQGKLDRALSVILVLAIVGAIGTLGFVVANPKVGEKFTEFYILGADGKADNYPTEITLGERAEVTVGIVNREQETTSYTVVVTINGQPATVLDSVIMVHDQRVETPVTFTLTTSGQDQKIEFALYKTDSEEPYLLLQLLLNVVVGK